MLRAEVNARALYASIYMKRGLVPSLILYRFIYTMYRCVYKHVALLTGLSSSRYINHCQQPG
jgi:hypothetical protein